MGGWGGGGGGGGWGGRDSGGMGGILRCSVAHRSCNSWTSSASLSRSTSDV